MTTDGDVPREVTPRGVYGPRGLTYRCALESLLAAAVNIARFGMLKLTSTGSGGWAAATA